MPNKPKSRISKSKGLSTKQRIKPWMVSVFVFLIAVVGVIVIYRSFAAELPQSVIDEIKVEVMFDGRAKVTVKSLNYEKIFNQADTAKALADPAYYNVLMIQVLEELRTLYEKKNPPPANPPPTTPNPTTPTPVNPSPVQPTTPSQSPSQNPSQTPNQNPSQPTTNPDQPAATPSGNIESQDKAQEAITSLEYDLQDPSTMTTYTGVAAFALTPPANLSQADTVGIYIDRKLYKAIKPTDKEFKIDTVRLENGVHRLDVVVYDKSDTPLARYVYMFKSENNPNLIERVLNTISQPIFGLLGL